MREVRDGLPLTGGSRLSVGKRRRRGQAKLGRGAVWAASGRGAGWAAGARARETLGRGEREPA